MKIPVFVICVEVIIYLLLYNLHDCTFNILLTLSLKYQCLITKISKIIEKTLLRQSCSSMYALYEIKLFSKCSTISSYHM